MNDLLKRLIARLKRVEREKVSWKQAVVTDNDPLTIKLNGSDTEVLVAGIDGLAYNINDVVTVLVKDTDMLALSSATSVPEGAVTYVAGDGLDLAAGVFSVDLKANGGLKIESTELAADVGSGSTQVAAGNDSRFPTSGQKNALAGSSGTPGSLNPFVTTQDSRLSDDRDPNAHATSHKDGGSDELKLHELGEPTANVDFNGFELEHVASGTQADSGVNLSQLDLVRMGFTVRPQADYATVQALDSYTGSGTGILEASANGDLLDALGLESEHWDYNLTFGAVGTPYAIARDTSGNFYVTFSVAGNYRVGKFNSSGVAQNAFSGSPFFGANGSGNGQFGGPCTGICVDSSGNIYVADSSNYRIQKFNSSGVYQAQVGSAGTGNGQFNTVAGPRGLARDSSNNIFAVDPYNARVQKFNSSLTYQSKFGSAGTGNGEFAVPWGIAIDGSNNIWVVDANNQRVQKFNSSGTYLSQFSAAVPDYPRYIAVDSSTNLYVTTTGSRVQKFNSSGTFVLEFGSNGSAHGQFRDPRGIAVDASSNLYVCDGLNNRVEKLVYTASSPVATGQTALVKDQAFGGPHVDHGVFEITATGGVSSKWKLERREDMDNGSEIMSGLLVNAKQRGPNIPGGMWYVSTPDPITVDSTAITFEQFQPGGPPTVHGFQHVHDGSDPIPVEDWIEVGVGSGPAFTNSWVNFGSGYNNAGYYKDPFGVVHLRGLIKSGTVGSGAFTLPAGYRPTGTSVFGVITSAPAITAGYVDISTAGVVRPLSPSGNSWLSLEGITFRAA